LQAFDVDDPTQNASWQEPYNCADSNDTFNEYYGNDNRGGTPGISPDGIVTRPVENGEDTVVCRYSIPDYAMCPGNNFKILVTTDKMSQDVALVNYEVENGRDNVWNSFGQIWCINSPPPNCSTSPLLSIWRKLHVERDSMGAPYETGTSTFLADFVLCDSTKSWDYNQFASYEESWPLNPNTNQTMPWLVTGTNGELHYIFVFQFTGMLGIASTGDPYELRCFYWDDDDLLREVDLPQPDTGCVESALWVAYIEVVYDTGNDEDELPWHMNFFPRAPDEPNQATYLHRHRQTVGDLWYWAAYVATLYEFENPFADNDPDEENAIMGGRFLGIPQVAAVFEEAIRDVGAMYGWSGNEWADVKRLLVLHEIGHFWGLMDNTDGDNCMSVPDQEWGEIQWPHIPPVFKQADIDTIRSYAGGPP
jgi:hypothetical protein